MGTYDSPRGETVIADYNPPIDDCTHLPVDELFHQVCHVIIAAALFSVFSCHSSAKISTSNKPAITNAASSGIVQKPLIILRIHTYVTAFFRFSWFIMLELIQEWDKVKPI